MLRSSLAIATLGSLLAAGLSALPAQARTRGAIDGHLGARARLTAFPGALAALAATRRAGTLTGVIDGLDHRPVADACVTATGAGGSAMTMTRADGRYVLPGLRPGTYALRYLDCSSQPRSPAESVSSAAFAAAPGAQIPAPAVVQPGQVKNLPTVTLPTGGQRAISSRPSPRPGAAAASGTGQIRGFVTGKGRPAGRVCVQAIPLGSGFEPTTVTSANGRYTLRKVQAGRYQVLFASSFGCRDPGNWLSQWYKGVTTPFPSGKAAIVRVAKGTITSGIDASLRRGGQISGTVRSSSGRPLLGICVTVNGRVAGGFTEAIPRTGKRGRYVVHGLFRGSYTVGFRAGCGSTGNYAPQWWRHAATLRAATHIHVAGAHKVNHIDGALGPGSAITGVVRGGSPSGPFLRGICVDAFNPRTDISAMSRTGRRGQYRLIGLAAGTYFVQYQTGCGNRGNYLERERSVKVLAGQTRRHEDAFLLTGARLSGTVTNMHGKPVGGICVGVASSGGGGSDVKTNSDGTYSAKGLYPGTYTVQFAGGCGNKGSYLPQYYNGKLTKATADPITLTAGHITTGIDAVMQPGATISGVLTDAAGHRLSGVCVGIARRSDPLWGNGFTDIEFTANGSYRASNLSPGAYLVTFGCGGPLARQWFRSRRTPQSADLVSAPAGQVTSGISAVVHHASSITGVVTSRAGGRPLNGVCVLAVPSGGPYLALFGGPGPVVRNGRYSIRHLVAGRYDVQFSTCVRSRYGGQWYRNERTQASATPVVVREGRATPRVDAKLAVGGSIAGRILSSTGRGGLGFCVQAYDAKTQSFRLAFTDSHGRYKIAGLSTGVYQIFGSDCRSAAAASTARPGRIHVHAPDALTGIDVRLPAGGSVSGQVLAGSSAAARGDVCVIAVPVTPGGSYGETSTNVDGTYRITDLATGKYQVYFADPYCFVADDELAPQWFDDQSTQATATQVAVAAGADTSGINATLANTGSISGSVTDAAHAPVSGECVTAVPVGFAPDPLLGIRQPPEIAVTTASGHYSLASVQPGTYKVKFSVGCGDSGFATQWWHGANSASATVITVGAGATVTGIDAALKH